MKQLSTWRTSAFDLATGAAALVLTVACGTGPSTDAGSFDASSFDAGSFDGGPSTDAGSDAAVDGTMFRWSYAGVQDPATENSTLAAGFGYVPWGYDPATIPVPSTNTHYVDNTAATCIDDGPGTVLSPRCSIPTSLPAGSVVQLEGGPYADSVTITAEGTVAEPVFIHGGGTISGEAVGRHTLRIASSSHLIIHGLDFDGSTIVTGNSGNGAFAIREGSDHITIRNSTIHDYPDPLEMSDRPGRSVFFSNGSIRDSEYVAIIGNRFTDIGTFPPSYETGKHVIAGGTGTAWIWIVGNEFVRGSEDAIQIRGLGDPNIFWIIAGNHFESMGENAIDIKTGSHSILTENTMCDFQSVSFPNGSGSDGSAIVFNDDNGGPRESWVINNTLTRCSGFGGTDGAVTVGFRMQSDSGTNYVVGNLFDRVSGRAIYVGSGSVSVIEMNTIYAPGNEGMRLAFAGSPGGSVVGNIVTHLGSGFDSIRLNQPYMDGWARDNVLFSAEGPVGSRRVDSATNLVDMDPLLTAPESGDFSLQPESPARAAVSPLPLAWRVFEDTYGLSIAVDITGHSRSEPASAGAFEPR